MNMMFDLFDLIFPVMFLLIFGMILFTFIRNCREIICIFLESMLIYVMNEFSDSGGHFHGT